MKKIAFLLAFLAGTAGAACFGPYCYDDKGAVIVSGIGFPTIVTTAPPAFIGQVGLDSSFKLWIGTTTTGTSGWWIQPKSQ